MRKERSKRYIGVTDCIGAADFLCFVRRSCCFQGAILWFEVVGMGLLFRGINFLVFVGLPHFLLLFLLFVHSLGPVVIVLHPRLHALIGLEGIIWWHLVS